MAKRSSKASRKTSKSERILVCSSAVIFRPPVVNAEVSFSKKIAPGLYTPEKRVSPKDAQRLCCSLGSDVRWVTDTELQARRAGTLRADELPTRLPKYVTEEIKHTKDEAQAALTHVGLTPKDLVDFHAVVHEKTGLVAFVGSLPEVIMTIVYGDAKPTSETNSVEGSYVDPLAKPEADGIEQCLVAAMLVACCRYAHGQQNIGFTLSQKIERLRMALRVPELREQVIHEHLPDIRRGQKIAESSSLGGVARAAGFKQQKTVWKNEAKNLRKVNPRMSKQSIATKIATTHGGKVETIRKNI
jgi:hypothetical protein